MYSTYITHTHTHTHIHTHTHTHTHMSIWIIPPPISIRLTLVQIWYELSFDLPTCPAMGGYVVCHVTLPHWPPYKVEWKFNKSSLRLRHKKNSLPSHHQPIWSFHFAPFHWLFLKDIPPNADCNYHIIFVPVLLIFLPVFEHQQQMINQSYKLVFWWNELRQNPGDEFYSIVQVWRNFKHFF